MSKNITGLNIFYWVLIAFIVIVAIGFRLDLYFFERSIWFDEAALYINLKEHSYLNLFSNLSLNQAAPPFFLAATKFLVNHFGYSEFVLRFLPLLAGLLSIFLFYKVASKILIHPPAIIFAMALFAVNINLIYYSQEFKQYSFDVFFTLLAIFIFLKLDYKSKISSFIAGFALALLPWFSHASIIITFSIFLISFVNRLKEPKNKFLFFVMPAVVNAPIYYFVHLKNAQGNEFLKDFWSSCYLDSRATNLLELLIENLQYTFAPIKGLSWFILLILIVASVLFFKSDKQKFWLLLTPYFVLLVLSFFHFYPYCDRLTLFLTPIFILIFSRIFAPLKPIYFVAIFMIAIFSIAPNFFKMYENMKNLPAQSKNIFKILRSEYSQGEVVVLNEFSKAEFSYYSDLTGFKPDSVIVEDYKTLVTPAQYEQFLRKLPKNYNYWFFTTQIFPTISTKEYIQNWAFLTKRPIKVYTKGASDLYYVRN